MNPPQTIVTHGISKEFFVCFYRLIQQIPRLKLALCTLLIFTLGVFILETVVWDSLAALLEYRSICSKGKGQAFCSEEHLGLVIP